ncbi:MAG TPA: hypothetical protein PK759_00375 [Spirochaetales bacterium]|nr:hypothetical protein [Spirochaetales bacterium]HOV94480.1 hypothetical protein [Spirochaetales bacterium]HPS14234.1 hypothetical protein [Spirochaetales bacterium]
MAFSDKFKDIVEKGIGTSRDFLSKAGSQAQTWTEMGKLRFEILQDRTKAQALMTRLGAEVYRHLVEDDEPLIGYETTGIAPLLDQIKQIEAQIEQKEASYRAAGGSDEDLNKDQESEDKTQK